MSNIDIDLTGGPTVAKFQTPKASTPVALGLAAIKDAGTIADLERVVEALRKLTEPEKAQIRPALKARVEVLKQVEALAVPAPAPAEEFVPTPTPASPTERQVIMTIPDVAPVTYVEAGSFEDIAAESTSNAAVAASGSLAEGTMRGVGFSTADGYLQALARGTLAHTRTEYVRVLKDQFGVTTQEQDWPLITQSDAPTSAGTTFTPAGPSIFDLPKAQRRASVHAPAPVRVTRKELTAGNLIAGASEDATGVFLSWAGYGEMHISAIEDALTAAHAPVAWGPARKSRHFHAAEALKPMNMNGLVVRAERGGTKVLRSPVTGTQRRYVAAWSVMLPAHTAVGSEAGKTVARFQLATSGELESSCEPGYEAHCSHIEADFARRVADEVLPAGDVTKWLRSVLVERLGAVRVGGNYYVQAANKDVAERICFALAQTWGMDWMLPALPVTTSNQLRAGLVRGFVTEVHELLDLVEKARVQARKDKKTDITPAAAASFLRSLRDVNERAKQYVEVLGPDSVASVSRSIKAAIDLLEPLCDSTAERFAALEPYAADGAAS